jgi:hypothetical protein
MRWTRISAVVIDRVTWPVAATACGSSTPSSPPASPARARPRDSEPHGGTGGTTLPPISMPTAAGTFGTAPPPVTVPTGAPPTVLEASPT